MRRSPSRCSSDVWIYVLTEDSTHLESMPDRLITAGTPATSEDAGAVKPSGTRAAAATIDPAPITARFSTTDPEPIRHPSSTVHPSRCALCPTTQLAPMTVGCCAVQCTIVPSWTDVRAPTVIVPWSPRSTAPGHTDACEPSVTRPITTASG